jgi:hypothetical protein
MPVDHAAAPRNSKIPDRVKLAELRSAFAAECEGWAGRLDTFEEFTTLLHEWGDVVTEAARRSWGLVGLP